MRADFHTHTTHSDGVLSVPALVARALAAGVTHLAITDHDGVAGVAEAAREAAGRLAIVAGLEVSAWFHGREVHVLGHFVLPDAPGLAAWSAGRGDEREARLRRMVERLRAAGLPVTFEEVLEESGGGTLARPHLARVLVKRGWVASMQDAFDRYLVPGTPGYEPRPMPSAAEAIALVKAAGGTASLAHPGANRISKHELADLAALGLDAVEAFHHEHPPSQRDAYERWGRALGLACTGGSDFHVPGEPERELGSMLTPEADVRAISSKAAARQDAPALAAARAAWTAAGGTQAGG